MQTEQEHPRYRLLAPCYLEDDILHLEGEEIIYTGTPNEEMEPLNPAARDKSLEFMTMLDDAARATAQAFGRPFTGRIIDRNEAIATSLDDAKKIARGTIVLPSSSGPVPIRPDLMTPQQRRLADMKKPKKVLGTKAPPKQKPVGTAVPVVLGNQRRPESETAD